MPGIQSSFEEMRSLESASWGSGVSAETVAEIEESLGCRITQDYRQFLLEFGWFEAPAVTIYGIADNTSAVQLDIRDVLRFERHESVNPLPAGLLPFSNDGAGNLSCLVLSGASAGSVVFVDHDRNDAQLVEPEATDFASWLAHRLEGMRRAASGRI